MLPLATKQALKKTITNAYFGENFKLLVRSFFYCWSPAVATVGREKGNFMYEAGSEQINCNGAVIALPSLEVVKAGK